MRFKFTFGDYGPKEKCSHSQLLPSSAPRGIEVEELEKECYKAKIVRKFFNSRNDDGAQTTKGSIIKKGPSHPSKEMLLVGDGEGGLRLCPIPLPLNYL